MKTIAVCLAALAALLGATHAQVPQLINYQGRVVVGTTNFNGTGQFKFALVNAAGTTTYWSNDGTSSGGLQPAAAVSLTVTKGLYSVLLGDTSLANMTTIPASVWANADVRLRVWFNDGTNGSQQLTPDQRIAPNGYLPDGAVSSAKLADGAVTSSKIAAGAVGGAQMATGAAAANLNASGQSGVPSGGVILSLTENSALAAAGYVKIGTTQANDGWLHRVTNPAPDARSGHTAVWTGNEMIVWGGNNAGPLSTGGRFNPGTNTWTALPTSGAPVPRTDHTAVWTGTEMIVWGGFGASGYMNDGARYDPAANSWTALPASGAPSARFYHTAVWSGTEMIVWGGDSPLNGGSVLGDGARYNRANNTWTALPSNNAPVPRTHHTAVWTGSEMIVWGGNNAPGNLSSGARYSPTTNTWTVLQSSGEPTARTFHTAVWSGSEMIIWGGQDLSGYPNDGSRYNPATSSWTALSATGAPAGRVYYTAVWSGSEMIVWGGSNGISGHLNDGSRYNPATNSWTALPATGGPSARHFHTAVWSGREMIIWGGSGDDGLLNDTWSETPGTIMFLYLKP